ncbi:MAG: hypothetical protein methR_P1945 [Methyloprofundus sp.]|nr:MAG: hypothetical protein methR_P1945 [Methyloprofundus sp.]
MVKLDAPLHFQQLHIDVVRNATDDYNLFHDATKWQRIKDNPFKGPIALGFQVESFIEHSVRQHRKATDDEFLIEQYQLNFSNYQFTFANAIRPEQEIEIDIKKTQFKTIPEPILSHRICVKSNSKLALMGYKKESQTPLFLADCDFSQLGDLAGYPDRQFLEEFPDFFMKRKFLNISNAKNFLCGSLANQNDYFDELSNTIYFPEVFPCSLISAALLEKAVLDKHDFEQNPMVYTSHKISLDKSVLHRMHSNAALHILLQKVIPESSLGLPEDEQIVDYNCYGLVANNAILFRAVIGLSPLAAILKK